MIASSLEGRSLIGVISFQCFKGSIELAGT